MLEFQKEDILPNSYYQSKRLTKLTTTGNTTASYCPADHCPTYPVNLNLPPSGHASPSAAAPSAPPAAFQPPQQNNHNNDLKSSSKSQNSPWRITPSGFFHICAD
eukprot:9145207-Ditylum_brightwellii.AAC.1